MEYKRNYLNPFIAKTPVRGRYFFGRDDLIEHIFRYIAMDQNVSLVGERRVGKTSILLRILDLKERFLSQPDQHVLVLLNFVGKTKHVQ